MLTPVREIACQGTPDIPKKTQFARSATGRGTAHSRVDWKIDFQSCPATGLHGGAWRLPVFPWTAIVLSSRKAQKAVAMSPLKRTMRQHKVGRSICAICNEPVTLETCKINENGDATHEDCYVGKICSELKQDQEKTVSRDPPPPRKVRSR
jgi:hypothetical protein